MADRNECKNQALSASCAEQDLQNQLQPALLLLLKSLLTFLPVFTGWGCWYNRDIASILHEVRMWPGLNRRILLPCISQCANPEVALLVLALLCKSWPAC